MFGNFYSSYNCEYLRAEDDDDWEYLNREIWVSV